MHRSTRQRARDTLADAIDAQGKAYRNTADVVRGGFENYWVKPALDAIEGLLRLAPDDEDEEDGRS